MNLLLAKIPESVSSLLMEVDWKQAGPLLYFTEILMGSELSTSWFAGVGSFLMTEKRSLRNQASVHSL